MTPAVKGWKVLAVLAAITVQQVGNDVGALRGLLEEFGWGALAGVVGVILFIGFGYSALAWRMTRYAIDAEAVHLKTGVLFRQQRAARLDRVQAVDVVQPLLARLFGLAELKIEVAGGSDSAVRIAYLTEENAQEVRNELLARAAGVEFGTEEQPQAPAAPEREVVAVPLGRLLVSLLRSGAVLVSAVVLVAVLVGVVVSGEWSAVVALLPAVLGSAGYLWQRFAGEFNFRVAQSPDGIRLRHGLLESRAQTVPPGRVQAVRLSQGLLWRGPDWWRVQVNVAGYGATEGKQTESVLLPVGTRDEALTALWLVLPDLGAQDPRALLDAALAGSGEEHGFLTSPRRARWLDPLVWRRNGVAVTDRAVLIRSGWLLRSLVVVPHERTQSVGLSQFVVERWFGLADVQLHSTPGPVTPVVPHLDAAAASRFVAEQARRARTARAAAGPERWMRVLQAEEQAQERAQEQTHAADGAPSAAGPVDRTVPAPEGSAP